MFRRSSDVGNANQDIPPGDRIETSSNHELDSPQREVVIDDRNPSQVQETFKMNKSAPQDIPPPPLRLLAQTHKSNGVNGDSSNRGDHHKCSGCGFSTNSLADLLDHGKICPQIQESLRSQPKQSTGYTKCTMCTQVFANLEDQIKHMTDFHKLKASFKCSFCRMSFGSKELIEAHIQTHAQKSYPRSPVTKVEISDLEENVSKIQEAVVAVNEGKNEMITNEVEDVDCLVCGKSFKDPVEHRNHETTCTGPSESFNEVPDQVQEGNEEQEEYPDYFPHFKHDHINLITDPKNPYCRGCDKTMGSVLGICNHLSRRHDCREWYCRNLSNEIRKSDEIRKLSGEPRPDPLPVRPRGTYARRSNASNSSHSNSPLPCEEQPPKRAASLLAQTHMKVTSRGQIIEGFEDKARQPRPVVQVTPSNKRPDGPHSIQCTNCQKIFDGRSPHVGFTNHQRGNADCRQHGSRRFITTPSKLAATNSPNLRVKPALSIPVQTAPKSRHHDSPTVELDEDEGKSATQYFYCKLCNDFDPKTRTSLGCHLTVHHGLPPVNCKNGNQDAFRCQTCCKMFNSKHYYNQHRHECDLQSEYVGFCDSDAKPGPSAPKRSRNLNSTPSIETLIPVPKKSSGKDCTLCGKSGFAGPNAVRIHMKYICVNRAKPDSGLSKTVAGDADSPKVPKLKIRTSGFPSPNFVQSQTRSSRFRDSIPQNSTTAISDSSSSDINRRSKSDVPLKCDDCGHGPYNNVHHFMEHQKNYCQALKRNSAPNGKRESIQDDIDQIRGSRSAKKNAQEKMSSTSVSSRTRGAGDQRRTVDNDPNGNNSIDILVDCSVCDTQISGLDKFVKHRLNHLKDDKEEFLEPKKCEVCLVKVFSCVVPEELKEHLQDHLNNKCMFKCKTCSVGFERQDQRMYHASACSKVQMMEPKPKFQDVLQRSLTCSICGNQATNYDNKVLHERKCREKFMKCLACSICGFQAESYDQKVTHERKCIDSFMTSDGFVSGVENGSPESEEMEIKGTNGVVKKAEMDVDEFDTDEKKMDNLRDLFKQLMDLINVEMEAPDTEPPENICRKMLYNLNEEPSISEDASELESFRSHIVPFLRLMVRGDTLESAYEDAGSVDEALFNLVTNYPNELQ